MLGPDKVDAYIDTKMRRPQERVSDADRQIKG